MSTVLDRSKRPAATAAVLVKVADPVLFQLDNGLEVILLSDHRLPLVSMQFRADVPPTTFGDLAGLADLFGELLTAGTRSHDKHSIDETVDSMGAVLQASAEGVYATCLREHAHTMMAVIADVVRHPVFPEEELSKARRRMLSAVAQRAHDPEGLAEVIGRRSLFGPAHPYGEVVTEKSLNVLDADMLRAWHAHAFDPRKSFLVLVGDLSEADARTLATAHFEGWESAGAPAGHVVQRLPVLTGPVGPAALRQVHVVHRPGAEQSVLRVGFPLHLPPGHVQALPARLMNTILGGGIFNARLMANLREDKGWTYGAYSALEVDRHNASLSVHVSVRSTVTADAVQEILMEMERMRNEPVLPTELELARSHLAGSFGRSLEDARTLAQFAVNIRLHHLPADHYRTYLQRLDRVTASDVMQAAQDFLHPDQATVFAVGDLAVIGGPLAQWGPVVQLDPDGVVVPGAAGV